MFLGLLTLASGVYPVLGTSIIVVVYITRIINRRGRVGYLLGTLSTVVPYTRGGISIGFTIQSRLVVTIVMMVVSILFVLTMKWSFDEMIVPWLPGSDYFFYHLKM